MILRRLQVQGFRGLRDAVVDFAPGLNVVRGPNEAGKSTLQAAIVALLFEDPGSTAGRIEGLRSWGARTLPVLSGHLADDQGEQVLVKDFENRRAELQLSDGTTITDRRRVNDEVAKLARTPDERVYVATACLLQQQWARVTAGAQVQELLQQALTGAAEGVAAEAIIRKLDGAITDLERGVKRHAPVNPGAIAVAEAALQKVEEELATARAEAASREHAAADLQRAQQRITEIDGDLASLTQLQERAAQGLKLEGELDRLREEAGALARRLERIQGLEGDIAALQARLEQETQVARELVTNVANWATREQERRQEAERTAEEIRGLEEERERLEAQAAQAARDRIPSAELERAMRLKDEADAARGQAEAHAETVGELEGRHAEGARRLTLRRRLIAAGALVALAGVGAALLLDIPALLALAGAGLALLVAGMLRRPSEGWGELPAQIEAARADRDQAAQTAQEKARELADLLADAGCEDISALAAAVSAGTDTTAALERKRDARQTVIAERRRALEQAQDVADKLQDKLRETLQATGFETVEALMQHAEEQERARADLRDRQSKLAGALDGETTQALEDRQRESLLQLRAREAELDTPEMQMARMSPEKYQELLDRISGLRNERRECDEQARAAQRTVDMARHDNEAVRVLEGQAEQWRERARLLRERLAVWTLAREVIASAQEETLADAGEIIGPRMGALLADLTGGRYRQAALDTGLAPAVTLPETGEAVAVGGEADRQEGALSCATREQAFLAARLAVIDMLWPESGPPLLLDDPLVNFDAMRRAAALEAIAATAQRRQVIVFTCSDEYDAVADCVIELAGPARPEPPDGR